MFVELVENIVIGTYGFIHIPKAVLQLHSVKLKLEYRDSLRANSFGDIAMPAV